MHMPQSTCCLPLSFLVMFLPLTPARAGELTAEESVRLQELDNTELKAFRNVDVAEYVQLRTKRLDQVPALLAFAEAMPIFLRKAVGTPYRLNAVRFDMAEVDCVVFVERALALSLARDWRSYQVISERLKHKDGVVAYRNRNFFTLGDWLPSATTWLLRDVTGEVGTAQGPIAATFTHVVRPKIFEEFPSSPGSKYNRIVFKGSDYKSPNKEVRSDVYVPREKLAHALPDLKTGDVVLVLRAAAGGHMGCDHMGLILKAADGTVYFVHAAPPAVRELSFKDFTERFPFIQGYKFLRVREDLDSALSNEMERLKDLPVPTAEEMDVKVQALRAKRAVAQ